MGHPEITKAAPAEKKCDFFLLGPPRSPIGNHWNPRIVGELNGQQVKLAKLKGEFIWHSHENEDEMFWIVKGKLKIEFRDKIVELEDARRKE